MFCTSFVFSLHLSVVLFVLTHTFTVQKEVIFTKYVVICLE